MPELPEVETTRCGIKPHIQNKIIEKVIIRNSRLRWPIPSDLNKNLKGQRVKDIKRRGKYLIIETASGHTLIHLGMSGSLRIVTENSAIKKHDHVDFILNTGKNEKDKKILRFHDPRRFGSILWTADNPLEHKLLIKLGPEPLTKELSGDYLFKKSRKKQVAIKNFIMDSHIVVGVGNIYASEALFLAGIRPTKKAGSITLEKYNLLNKAIKKILKLAIKQGGTTLRDFVNTDGNPGYFKQKLNVYGRKGEPCKICKTPIKQETIGQRASYYCGACQK